MSKSTVCDSKVWNNRIRIRMVKHWFGSLDPDPHWGKKLDQNPDPHWNQCRTESLFMKTMYGIFGSKMCILVGSTWARSSSSIFWFLSSFSCGSCCRRLIIFCAACPIKYCNVKPFSLAKILENRFGNKQNSKYVWPYSGQNYPYILDDRSKLQYLQ